MVYEANPISRTSNCALCDGVNCLHVERDEMRILSRVNLPFLIGKYTFRPGITSSDRIYIQKSDGEGMEVSIEKLEKLLDEFWEKEF